MTAWKWEISNSEISSNCLLHYRAHEYIQKSLDIPSVWYKININQVGKSSEFNLLFLTACVCGVSGNY